MLVCPRCENLYPAGSQERCPLDGSLLYILGSEGSVVRPWAVGDIIAEKYKLIEEREQRVGTGLTFLAEQLRFNRVVELRILSSSEGLMMPTTARPRIRNLSKFN